jgi:cell division cycle 2-like protein
VQALKKAVVTVLLLLYVQLISAVAYLHRRWVVHRDIKMSNLLYSSKTGLLKLCDFGLARWVGMG